MPYKYKSVSIPEDLYRKIIDVIKDSEKGYTSISEFIKDAVRRRLEELKNEKMEVAVNG